LEVRAFVPLTAVSGSTWFEERDRQGLLDFWHVYDEHYDEVSRSMAHALSADAKLSRIFDGPGVVGVRKQTRELVRRSVTDGDWSAYEAQLRASAANYARAGLTLERWYVLTICLSDVVTPHMVQAYGGESARLKEALRAMQRFLDRVRVTLSTEFLAAHEQELAESEKRMRALAARLQSAIEEERRRMAREIHDDLGQLLTALKLDHSWVLRRFETRDRTGVAELLADMDHLLDTAVATVQRLATDLRPDILDELGLLAALEWQAYAVERRSGIRFELTLPEEELDVPDEQATAIFRMFQEILTNVVRHAGAKNVAVHFEVDAGSFMLEVRDDGRGISPTEAASGTSLGLVGMRERAALLGGSVEISGVAGRGTTVLVQIPILGVAA
jgi:signal transduction histidine kinase